ncbi:MAG: hypothetical protein HLUCCA11_04985 [Phormidesmis priestleyi Ana]|uniref:Uncharacterized protein n=1 Tax=Phormidesmis priestleyi Ana TaxID=1666911 RepID=A0A0P8BS46_9CYAN|nr:MAG: hypothetical protein HLUCCA11_04985 [Phormidesmis priestleyi Ana]
MSSAASRPPQSLGQPSGQLGSPSASQPASWSAGQSVSKPASSQSVSSQPVSSQPVSQSSSGSQPTASASNGNSLRKPPSRPQLMGPPARPQPPMPHPETAPKTATVPGKIASSPPPEPAAPQKIGPISQPSERMQYRAIGLLKGKYIASEEQFNRGNIAVEDGTLIDAVLLGRVTSLIKKHIDLESDHIWVVYPRTLYSEENVPNLHVQIVGVWEPETLNARNEEAGAELEDAAEGQSEGEASKYLSTAEATEQCDTFSVRGEVAKYSEEKNEIVINIVQKSRSETAKPKRPFKLLVSGQLEGRTTGYFWDLQVEREEGKLMLKEATQIAVVPPKRKPKNARGGGGGKRRPSTGKPRSSSTPVAKPVTKPVPKPKGADEKAVGNQPSADAVATNLPPSAENTGAKLA